ncbi:type IV secretory system conjugative DNA transfer family protein [Moraxella marmotae]|uniref:type IV secretory system conjugative DNA transfer family protein n=1 Tax=Moraxella marmotae TaxID=3344520 RepID=UPI0035F24D91
MKTQKFLTVLACCLGAVFASQAQAKYQIDDQNDGYFATTDDFLKAQSRIHRSGKLAGGMEDAVRLKAVEDYAKSVAMQASIRNHMREVSQTISANSRNLDAIYDFSPLMIQGKVVPPVVVEAVDLYNQSGKMPQAAFISKFPSIRTTQIIKSIWSLF